MQKETISDRQGITLMIMFLIGTAIVIVPGLDAKKDVWLAVAFTAIIASLVSLIYARLLSTFPGKDIFDIMNIVLGIIPGKVISVLYIWFAFHLGALVLRNMGEFIRNVGLRYTPMVIPILCISLLCMWGVKEGLELLGRMTEFFTPMILLFLVLTLLSLTPLMDINNILPIFYDGLPPLIKGSFSLFSFPYAETVVFTMILCHLKTKKSPYKIYTYGILIYGILGVFIVLSVILVLGVDITSNAYFPTYLAARKISLANFFQSFEIIVSLSFLIAGFIKLSICTLAACNGLSKIFGFKDYRFIVLPVTLLMVNLSLFVYDNIKQMYHWALAVWPNYAFLFQVILPVILLTASEIKLRSKKLA
ncbi:spore germination protein YndE [Oxobacter pfennigii]|uniref:Spore germination protein YndE n=1 Tax=Oxobacter pfennigii TaxID=36849 RepID=A0A0P8WSA7_9CLOT|nr:endospore germination permease [Oxobacter pfennigii]KPU45466.1 spore germination protein YndE [Oxobacter pfennigii]